MLTVLMPVYNAMPYLGEAVESVVAQDAADFTLLALDGGSTDGSVEFLHSVQDSRMKVVAFNQVGLGASLKHGLEICETELFARMDADDRCDPTRFSRQLAFLRDHPEVGMVGTHFRYFGSSGKKVLSPRMPCDHAGIAAGLNEKKLTIVHGSIMARTYDVRRAGGYRVKGMGEDWDMFLRVSEATCLANLPDDLYEWRLHSQNAGLSHLMDQQIGIDFACECARLRREGLPEISFESFVESVARRSSVSRLFKRVDVYSLAQYRIALTMISNGKARRGFARLAYSAICSPPRTLRRLRRVFQSRR